jgi:hypothetical protein
MKVTLKQVFFATWTHVDWEFVTVHFPHIWLPRFLIHGSSEGLVVTALSRTSMYMPVRSLKNLWDFAVISLMYGHSCSYLITQQRKLCSWSVKLRNYTFWINVVGLPAVQPQTSWSARWAQWPGCCLFRFQTHTRYECEVVLWRERSALALSGAEVLISERNSWVKFVYCEQSEA